MGKREQIWESLNNKEYRDAVSQESALVGIPFQVHRMMDHRGWTDKQLAEMIGVTPETIGEYRDPNNEHLNLKALWKLASVFDVALQVRFVPFSQLVDQEVDMTPEYLLPPSFEEEK